LFLIPRKSKLQWIFRQNGCWGKSRQDAPLLTHPIRWETGQRNQQALHRTVLTNDQEFALDAFCFGAGEAN
jgi:hypothetical protein